ncbi:MAG: sarcosine oxidase subunit gamma [Ahrensia sp.]|nr:sarcosine oxidase subunit gamma [Ahrensia sp.]
MARVGTKAATAATKDLIAARTFATAGMRYANATVTLDAAAPAARVSLRAADRGIGVYSRHLGFELPTTPGATASKGSTHALWLGPDEWLILDTKNANAKLVPTRANAAISATDVSHRNVGFILTGAGAADGLNAACPRDLSLEAFPAKTASRTILGKAEIVLYRTARDAFRVECWRSYVPYVWGLLVNGAQDAHL